MSGYPFSSPIIWWFKNSFQTGAFIAKTCTMQISVYLDLLLGIHLKFVWAPYKKCVQGLPIQTVLPDSLSAEQGLQAIRSYQLLDFLWL